MNMPSLEV